MKTKMTFKAALDAYIEDNHPTIVKRELVANGRIRATDSEGMVYLSLDTKAVLPGSFQDEKTKKYFAPISNELQTTDMLNANRDMATFNATYRNGLAEEKRVIEKIEREKREAKEREEREWAEFERRRKEKLEKEEKEKKEGQEEKEAEVEEEKEVEEGKR